MVVHNNSGVATIPFQCADGQGLQGRVPTTASGPYDVSDYTWENIKINSSPSVDELLMYLVPGWDVEPYGISLNGTSLDGVFLGSNYTATWAFREYVDNEFGTYWLPRLLHNSTAQNGEVTGFLRVYT